MATSIVIPKDPVYPHSMDWNFLRQEGIQHIEQLSSAIWTDYNLHDPGITILEVLCYAITDLGYRANLPPADLFAVPGGKPFFTAAQILPCGPVTAFDYRKLLIDITGVKNAWVEQLEEPEVRYFFTNPFSKKAPAALASYYHALGVAEPAEMPVVHYNDDYLAAIYKCQSEKDRQLARDHFDADLDGNMKVDGMDDPLKHVLLLYTADRFFEEARYFLECQLPGEGQDDSLSYELAHLSYEPLGFARITDYFKIADQLRRLRRAYRAESFDFDWTELDTLIHNHPEVQDFLIKDPLIDLLMAQSLGIGAMPAEGSKDDFTLFKPLGVYAVTLRLEPGQEANEDAIKQEALRRLHLWRNLDEDFSPAIHIVETIDIGIDLSITVDPTFDVLEVMSAVIAAVDEYMSPTIPFYSLEQRLNKYATFLIDADVLSDLQDAQLPDEVIAALSPLLGEIYQGDAAFEKAVASAIADNMADYYDDIFVHSKKDYDADPVYQGPLLTNGFIDDGELAKAQPRQTIYRSDLYRLIAAVPGVRQVVRIEMFNCKDPDHSRGNWCLAFPCRCLPQLKLDCCILAIRSGSSDMALDMAQLEAYMEAHPPVSTRLDRSGMEDLPVPEGNPRGDVSEYTSVQVDFPRTYKIGNTGISNRETDLRKAQVRQMEGYLVFYDQLLANYLGYLGGVRNMLSVEGGDFLSYQPLYDIPGIMDLLLDFAPGGDWAKFKADPNNAYMQVLRQLAQGSDTDAQLFRDQVLDHLLARFGEAFTDYTLQLYRIDRPIDSSNWDAAEGLADDILDKQSFLANVPGLGAGRAKGFNYHFANGQAPLFWDIPDTPEQKGVKADTEGVKKRVCAILGIRNNGRHTITCEPQFVIEADFVQGPAGANPGRVRYEFYLKATETDTTRLLVSTAKFSTVEAAGKAGEDFRNMAAEKSNYGIIEGSAAGMSRVGYWVNIAEADRTAENALLLEPTESADDATPRLNRLRDLATGSCEDDSFHLLEHILLRPRSEAYSKILNPMIAAPGNPEILDPYSFWITVVLPDWSARFKEDSRRGAFVQTFMRELPAQLEIRFVRLAREAMFRFEQAYYNWMQALCSEQQEHLPATTDALVGVMNDWDDSIIDYFPKTSE